MRIVQIINNNFVISQNKMGEEIIIYGKGIGFHGKRGQKIVEDQIQKVFKMEGDSCSTGIQTLLQDTPEEVVTFGLKAVEYIEKTCSKQITSRYLFVPLVDHLNTTLERCMKGIEFSNESLLNIPYLYREEYKIAQDVCDMMTSEFEIKIPESEAAFITLHIIDSELNLESGDGYKANNIISMAVQTIEDYFQITIQKENYVFARFVTHLQFFAKRVIQGIQLTDEDEIQKYMRKQHVEAYKCAKKIVSELEDQYHMVIDETEITYLTIHIAYILKESK